MADQTCPPLPDGSVDFDAFHKAVLKTRGDGDLSEALDAATFRPAVPADPPALKGKTKAQLQKIAADEGVYGVDGLENDEIAAAIESHRNPPPPEAPAATEAAPAGDAATGA